MGGSRININNNVQIILVFFVDRELCFWYAYSGDLIKSDWARSRTYPFPAQIKIQLIHKIKEDQRRPSPSTTTWFAFAPRELSSWMLTIPPQSLVVSLPKSALPWLSKIAAARQVLLLLSKGWGLFSSINFYKVGSYYGEITKPHTHARCQHIIIWRFRPIVRKESYTLNGFWNTLRTAPYLTLRSPSPRCKYTVVEAPRPSKRILYSKSSCCMPLTLRSIRHNNVGITTQTKLPPVGRDEELF